MKQPRLKGVVSGPSGVTLTPGHLTQITCSFFKFILTFILAVFFA